MEAVAESSKHTLLFDTFTQGLLHGDVLEWERMVSAWESDQGNPDPYRSEHSGMYGIAAEA